MRGEEPDRGAAASGPKSSGRGGVRSHPSLETLVDYHSGELSEGRLEKVRAHLVDCAGCLESFLEIRRFEVAAAQGADPELDEVRHEGWSRLEGALAAQPAAGHRPAPPSPLAVAPAPAVAVRRWQRAAAVLAMLAVGAGIVAALALARTERLEDALARAGGSGPAVERLRQDIAALRQDLNRTEGELELSLQDRDRLAAELEETAGRGDGHAGTAGRSVLAMTVRPTFLLRAADPVPVLRSGATTRLAAGGGAEPLEARLDLPAGLEGPELLFLLRDAEGRVLTARVEATRNLRGDQGTAVTLRSLLEGEYRLEVVALGAVAGRGEAIGYRFVVEATP